MIRNPLISDRLLIFVHIPKTAGTSLRSIVLEQFENIHFFYGIDGNEKSINSCIEDYNQMVDKIKLNNIDPFPTVIMGHIEFGIHRSLKNYRYCTYATFLRDPIDRIISYYFHVRNFFDETHFIGRSARNMTLEEFVRNRVSPETDNWQTRIISGMIYSPKPFDSDRVTPEILELAKTNLRKYFIFGLTERFQESIEIFSEFFRWENVTYVRANVNPDRIAKEELPAATLDILAEHSYFDIKLYRYAKQLFEQQREQLSPDKQKIRFWWEDIRENLQYSQDKLLKIKTDLERLK
ncbi:sulfotransferase family 2 domain-containing protein [Baaleninema simplex]|uniref:sulfotransferase family 2 domain-containing protein n=1 Tax=Baaleninema simplex TaxID=2862350 RepID=UPI00034D5075|nr:sulfotransferase family 2 domain-containing protein [Baaleninema simplex]